MEQSKQLNGEKYNLRWNSYRNSLVSYLGDHLMKEELVDVTLSCAGKYIKAHKLILSSCSNYFKELFQIHKAQNPIIILNNVKFEQLKHVIDFIYNGEIKVLGSDLEGVLILGNNLKIKGLSNIKEKNVSKKTESSKKELLRETQNETNSQTASGSTKTNMNDTLNLQASTNVEPNGKTEPQKAQISTPTQVVEMPPNKNPVQTVTVNSEVQLLTSLASSSSKTEHFKDSHQTKRRKTCSISSSEKEKSTNNITEEPVSECPNVVNYIPSKNDLIPTSSLMNVTTEKTSPNLQQQNQNQDTSLEGGGLENPVKIEDESQEEESPLSKQISDITCDTSRAKPVSAFMIFAKEWRKRLAVEHPGETNKQISIRLSKIWKNLSEETKDTFYEVASRAYEKQKNNVKLKN